MHACGTLSFCPCSVMQKKTITSIFKLHVHRTLYAYICTWGPHLHSELLDDEKEDGLASFLATVYYTFPPQEELCPKVHKQTNFVCSVALVCSSTPSFEPGNQLMKEEKYKEAIECYTRAMELDNTNAVFPCNRFVNGLFS